MRGGVFARPRRNFYTFLIPLSLIFIRWEKRILGGFTCESIGRNYSMNDLIYLAALCGFFIVSGAYVRFCEKL